MEQYYLNIELLSDTSFSRGEGLTGEVDSEIQYDTLGCPYINARTIKGILVEECADILQAIPSNKKEAFQRTASQLFGMPGQLLNTDPLFQFGNAYLPGDFRNLVHSNLTSQLREQNQRGDLTLRQMDRLTRESQNKIMNSLTSIRTQTAIDIDGVAREHSLRALRVILRKTLFEAELTYVGSENEKHAALELLAACIKSFRRAGSHRNRGLGKLHSWLADAPCSRTDITDIWFEKFVSEVKK